MQGMPNKKAIKKIILTASGGPFFGKTLKELENVTKVRVLPYHNYAGSKYEALGMENSLPVKLPDGEEIKNAENLLTLI